MATHPTTERTYPLKPILTSHLFPKLDGMLIEMLRSLNPEEWKEQTVSPKWKVKDVAAHLLDTALRGISFCRDGYAPPAPNIDSPAALGAYIDRMNEEGVKVYRRLSPTVLISLMETACKQLAEYHAGREPFAQAPFGVSWAGEEKSANWFDTAREYTERWHHQQQIRLAVERPGVRGPGIVTRELYYPVLDCFMRALPFTYRNVSAAAGTSIRITVSGECGGSWNLLRGDISWVLTERDQDHPAAETIIPQGIAWRIFTKGVDPASARLECKIIGDPSLGLHVLGMVSIVSA